MHPSRISQNIWNMFCWSLTGSLLFVLCSLNFTGYFFLIHYNNKFARWRYQRMFDSFLLLFLITNLNTFYIFSQVLFEVTFKTLLCSNIWILSSNKYQVKSPKHVNLILTVTIKAICLIAYILRKNTLVLWYVFVW